MLLATPVVLKSLSTDLTEKSNQIKSDIKDIKTALKDKKASADFNNNELKKKNSELQIKIQDFIKLLSTNMPTGTSDQQKAAKANLLDQKNYFKIQLQSILPELQAQIVYLRTCITAKTNKFNSLNNRSRMLNSMLVTNKDNGVVMLPERQTNVQNQKTAIEADIKEATAEKLDLENQLQDVLKELAQLRKFLNDKSIN